MSAVFKLGIVSLFAVVGHLITATAQETATVKTPPTKMMTIGKVLLDLPLNQLPDKSTARSKMGDWQAADGAVSGAEKASDMHGAVMRFPLKFRNAVIRYEFQLNGCKTHTLSLNDEKEHVARVLMTPKSFATQKDDHDHQGPDKAVKFQTGKVALKEGVWHTLVVELNGPEMVAVLNGTEVSLGAHQLLDCDKANFGFTVAGQSAKFRNLTVWEATPQANWGETKAKLLKH